MTDKPVVLPVDSRITHAEIIELFGAEMPSEAVNLLWFSPEPKTTGEIRAELREIAQRIRISSQARPDGELVEALGEALFALSDKLRSSGFLESDEHHVIYERVVLNWQNLRATAALSSERIAPQGEGRYAIIVEAVGEQEAERLIVADMGSVDAVYEHLVSIGTILS